MLNIKHRFNENSRRIVACDDSGNSETFDTVKQLAERFNVTPSAVYYAMKGGRRLRGCEIRFEDVLADV